MNPMAMLEDVRDRLDGRPMRGAAIIVFAGALGLVAGAMPSHAMGGRDTGSGVGEVAAAAPAVGAPAPVPAAGDAAGEVGSSTGSGGVRGLFDRLLGRDSSAADCALVGVRADDSGASQLFWFDVATGRTMNLTADLPNADVRAVEVSPVSGAVYVVTGGRGRYPGRLYVVEAASGRLKVVGELGGSRADALGDAAFHPDGTLWAFRRNVGLVTINLRTGWSRVVWPVAGDGIGLAWDGLAWDPAGEHLYGAQGGDLYRWDPRTRSASVLCRSGLLPADVAGLDFRADGTLVAGRRSAATGNLTFVTVDLESCTVAAADHDVAAPGVTSFSYAACGKPGALAATIWRDENANGTADAGEPPLAGVDVVLRSGACVGDGEVVARARTAADGRYSFDDVPPGPYCVEVEKDAGRLAPVITTGSAGRTVVVPAGSGGTAGEAPEFGLLDEAAYTRITGAAAAPAADAPAPAQDEAQDEASAGPGTGLDAFAPGADAPDSAAPDSEDPILQPIYGDGGCNLYPIAMSSEMIEHAEKGARLGDIWNGTQPGNFGWLTWTGKLSTGVLATSLTPPGDSYTYINPQNRDDHTVSVGDWVKARPGVSNRSRIRDALDILTTIDIVVPVWDRASGRGSKARYRISDYATVHLDSYRLPGTNRITATYVGEAECDIEYEKEEPEVEFCPYDLDVPVDATFNIRDYVHRKNDEDDDPDKPIDWSRVTFTYRDDAGESSLMDWHLDDFNAGRDVTVTAQDMAPGTGNHGDGQYRIYMVRDGALVSDDHMTIRVNDKGADDVDEARCDYERPEEEVPEVEFCPLELGVPVGSTFDLREYVSYRDKDDDDDDVDWSRVAFTYVGGGANDPVPGNWHLDDFNAGRKVTVTEDDMAAGTGNDGDGRYRIYVIRDGKTRYDDFVTVRVNIDGDDDVDSARCEFEREREHDQKEVDFCPLELNLEVGDTFNIRDYIREKDEDSDDHKDKKKKEKEHDIDWRQVHFTYTDGQAADPPHPGDWHLDDFNAGRDVTVTAGDMAGGTGNDGDGRYRLYVVRDGQTKYDDYITIRVDQDGESEVDSVKCKAEKEKKEEAEVEFCPVVFNVTVGDTFNIREYVHHKDSDEGKDDKVDWKKVRFTYVEAGADDPPDDGNWHLDDFNAGRDVTITAEDLKAGTGNHGDGEYRLYVKREGKDHYDDFVTIKVNDIGTSDVETARCGQEPEKDESAVPEVEFCPFEMKVAVGDTFNIRDYLHEKDDDDEEHPIDWNRVRFTYTDGDSDDRPKNGNWHLDDFNSGRDVKIERKDMERRTGNHGRGVYRLYVKRDDKEHYDDYVTIRVNDDGESDVETARCDADNSAEKPEPEVEFCPLVLDVPVGSSFKIRDYLHHKETKGDDDKVEWSKIKFTYVDGGAKDPPTPGGWHLDDFNSGRAVTVTSADMAPGTGNRGAGEYRLYVVRKGRSSYDDYVTIRVNNTGLSNVEAARCSGPTLYPAPTAEPSAEPSPEPSPEPSAEPPPQPSPEPLTSGVVQGSVYLKLCPPPESAKNELSDVRGPVDVVHVIDVSGSMGWGWGGRRDRSRPRKLTSAKQALIAFNNFLDPALGDQAGLASFGYGQTVKGYVGAYARTDMRLTDNIDAVNSRISSLYPKAWTPLALGIREGTGVLFGQRRNEFNVPVLIVTSDGNANTRLDGIHYGTTALERQGIYDARSSAEAIQMSLAARARGAEVYAIAVGDDLDEQVMRAIASPDTNGVTHFYKATTGDDLSAVYDAIMSTASHLKRTRSAGQCDLDYLVPAASAKVRLLNEDTSAVYATNSSASGRFTLTGVPVGTYRLLAQDGTYDQVTVEPCVQGNDTVRVLVADGATTYQDLYLGEAVAKECPASYALQKTLTSPDPAQVGETVTFEIRVVNTDPKRTITTLPLMDTFDNEYLKFLTATPMPDQVSQVTGIAMWSDVTTALGDILPGGEIVVTVQFRAAKGTGMTVAVNRARTENGVDSGGYHLPTLDASDTVKIGAAGVFAYILLDPTITSVCSTEELGFTATAYDANYGTTNGAGIERVLFQVFNEHGALVYEKTERQVNYCGFGGNGVCPQLDLSKGVWTSVDGLHTVGGPIEFGQRYTLKVTAFGLSGDATSVSRILNIVLCGTDATATPTATATYKPTPTWTPSPSPTPTSTPTPTPTLTPTVTPSPTGHPIGSVLDNFGCSQVAAFCNLGNWVDASAAQTLADAANANLVPSMDVAWHAITPRRTGDPWLETGVNVPTWFWLDGGYQDTIVDNGNTKLTWQSLGPVAWCLGAGTRPMFSMDNGYAFDLPLSAVDTVNPAASVKSLPLPRFEYSSLGQPYRMADGPYAGVSSFEATVVSTWWVTGQVDTGSGIVSVNTEVPYCDRVNVWVRQPQSILVEPQQVPDWVNTP